MVCRTMTYSVSPISQIPVVKTNNCETVAPLPEQQGCRTDALDGYPQRKNRDKEEQGFEECEEVLSITRPYIAPCLAVWGLH